MFSLGEWSVVERSINGICFVVDCDVFDSWVGVEFENDYVYNECYYVECI